MLDPKKSASNSSRSWWQKPRSLVVVIPITGVVLASLINLLSDFSKPPLLLTKANEEIYFVIAGESESSDDLANISKTMSGKHSGESFRQKYQDIRICNSRATPDKYYLVLGSNLLNKNAIALMKTAKNDGFRQDTYVQQKSKIDFEPYLCMRWPSVIG